MARSWTTSDKKQALLFATPPIEQRLWCPNHLKLLVVTLMCSLAFLHVIWQHWPQPVLRHCNVNNHDNQTFAYPGEKITWHACGEVGNRTLECSNITVPMDQFNATNSADKTFVIPLIRLRGLNATQNVLFNPGGPGGSGMLALYSMGDKLHAMIGEGFHLLSFDPRGINSTVPAVSCYPDSDPAQKARHMQPLIHQAARTADLEELVAWASNYVKACADNMGKHGSYVNTPQTAADMNNILDAVGQTDMLYYGISYGTLLGQTYAAMFPERSRRVIIDGVVNIFQWYSEPAFSESMVDHEIIFDNFLEECVKAGPQNCTLASAGRNASQIKTRILDTAEALELRPLSVYINSTHYGLVTAEMVLNSATFRALYRPSSWPEYADTISQLLDGNGTALLLEHGLIDPPDMTAFNFVMSNDGLSGAQYWDQGVSGLERVLSPMWNFTLAANSQNIWYIPKQQWALAKTHNFELKRPGAPGYYAVETAHPILILSTTYDPVTPLRSAMAAKSAFKGSQIIEVKGYGHASIAEPSRCLLRKFRAYLYEGIMPGDSTCEIDLPYFPRNENRDKIESKSPQLQDDFERAYAAQVAIAKEWPSQHY